MTRKLFSSYYFPLKTIFDIKALSNALIIMIK